MCRRLVWCCSGVAVVSQWCCSHTGTAVRQLLENCTTLGLHWCYSGVAVDCSGVTVVFALVLQWCCSESVCYRRIK